MMSRFTKHLIFLGLKVIGFIIGYGFFFLSSSYFISDLIQKGFFGTNTEIAKWIIPAIPTAGLIFLIVWLLRVSTTEPRCQHCGKRLLDDPKESITH